MFFIQETEACNFVDDTAIYSCSSNFDERTLKLSNANYLIFNWFRYNSMVGKPGKFQIIHLELNINNNKVRFMIENKRVKSRSDVKLPSITINDKLYFTTHTENVCSTASNSSQTLARTRKFLSFKQAKHPSESYITLILDTVFDLDVL